MKVLPLELTHKDKERAKELNEWFCEHLDDCTTIEQKEVYIHAAMLLSWLYREEPNLENFNHG